MADLKISQLTAITTLTPATDILPVVDVTGTTKKITTNQILGSGGTATLASATISGDLTVDTSTLKVDSANNRVGIGTASPAAGYTLDVVGSSRITGPGVTLTLDKTGAAALQLNASGNAGAQLSTSGVGGLLVYTANGIGGAMDVRHQIASDGVATWSNVGGVAGTAMTLNSTGLGVGASPTQKLSIAGAIDFKSYVAHMDNFAVYAHTSDGTTISSFSGYPIGFRIANSEKMRIDTSGNVGIGVAPSAWVAGAKAIQFGAYGSLAQSSSGNIELSFNSYNSGAGAYKYLQNDTASLYRASSVHSWFTATSGFAGNLISFGDAKMTLDASGRLLVGKTSGVNSIETVGAGVDGRGTVAGVSTVATTIYTIKQSATAAMCVVFGDNGTDGFCDIVLFLATVAPKVVSSQTLYGSPAARTYSASTTNLQLALASGTLSIRTAALSTLNT